MRSAAFAGVRRRLQPLSSAGALLHFFPADAARDLVASYVPALASGSYLVLSAGYADGDEATEGAQAYSSGGNQSYIHPLAEPGIVDARTWHPAPGEEGPFPPRSGCTIVGVARVVS
jgi:hypothetical protein